jgi:hypothetical protein
MELYFRKFSSRAQFEILRCEGLGHLHPLTVAENTDQRLTENQLDSQLVGVVMKMARVQFGLIVILIQMKWMKLICILENMTQESETGGALPAVAGAGR